ncbi:translational GTPase TypA [Candidatus Falkowbacteria bacterium]|nr:translational GTPase TypA [Candidatus Falkowbacteria bacterium]
MKIRNVAIIAHVDHGKTTLVDALLKQSHTKVKDAPDTLIMDSNDLEKERGITIFSKNAAVTWEDYKINIIDTPGHADFGGEVERVLKMADGCLLLVDAKEGPMPQTRFVLKKALNLGLKVIVVINKIDKDGANPAEAVNKTFDLFVELGAPDYLLEFPIVYASAKQGLAGLDEDINTMTDIAPIFDAIIEHIPAPNISSDAPLQILITNINYDSFKGRIATGRVVNGVLKAGERVARIDHDGKITFYRPTAIMTFSGLDRIEAKSIEAGDITAISGIPEITIGDTLADPITPTALPVLTIEEPTVKMKFLVNDSPLAGREGQFTTSRQIRERLFKELENDMALKVEDADDGGWMVSGRGELHLAIFIERLRREGYEIQVARPQVIAKTVDGKELVPFEEVSVEVPEVYSGAVIQKLGSRHGVLKNMHTRDNIVSLEFTIPTRGLFGYQTEFMTDTKGMGILNSSFLDYRQDSAAWPERERGSLIAHEAGQANAYAIRNLQDRGTLFFSHGANVYKGQVVGQNSRKEDLTVNICKAKELSNMRSKGDGVSIAIDVAKTMDLEAALEYISDDELVEVTPKSVRIRKMVLNYTDERKKQLGIK